MYNVGDFAVLEKCEFPVLQAFSLNIKFNERKEYFPFISHKLFPDVKSLAITSSDPQPDIIQQNFQGFEYYRLIDLKLQGLHLEEDHMKQLSSWNYFDRIKSLDLSGNFLFETEQSPSFQKLTLTKLILSQSIIGDKFQLLCSLNTEFLLHLDVTSSGITNKGLINFLNCKQKTEDIVFPKLSGLILNNNYIFSEAIEKLFDGNVPQLTLIELIKIESSDLFNIIFRSDCSKRIQAFFAQFNYMEAIDESISKKNTRRLIQIGFGSQSLRDQDYQTLANFQFLSLIDVQLILSHIEECKTLEAIRNITAKSFEIHLNFQDSQGLNAKCLEKTNFPVKNIIPSTFTIDLQSPLLFLRSFVDSFINGEQHLQNLIIPFTYISCDKIISIAQNSYISQLSQLILTGNNLTDECVKQLLSKNFQQTLLMSFQSNPLLTSQALSKMKNKTYSLLQFISFKDTSISDKGIYYLVKNKFPSLKTLVLGDSDLTGNGLEILSFLQAPLLQILDISCNRLEVEEIKKFNPSEFHNLKIIYIYPSLTEEENQDISFHFNQKRKQVIQIQTSITYLVS